jgi:hypothetical protein
VKPLKDLPDIFLMTNDKGEKYQLKLEGLAHIFLYLVMCLEKSDCSISQIGLSSFTQQNLHLSFHLLYQDLKHLCNM